MYAITVVNLWPDGSSHNPTDPAERPRIEIHEPAQPATGPRAAIIICPGGGYTHRAEHERAPFARLFAEHGIVGIVCHYRAYPHLFPAPIADAARAVRLTRHLADRFGIDPDRVGLMGFSAGGHLACTTGTQPDLHRDPQDDLADQCGARPDRLILAYPVVSMVKEYHHGSVERLLDRNAPETVRRQMSNELHVTRDNPPTFLFHTADDPSVPVSNSIRYATACLQKGVPAELHVYESRQHGVGLATDLPRLRSWTGLLLDWLADWQA